MRALLFAASRTVRLVIACCVMLSLLAPAALAEGTQPQRGMQAGPGAPSAPLSFSPLPEVRQASPRFEAQAFNGHFTFDATGYTLIAGTNTPAVGGVAGTQERKAATVRMQFEGAAQALLVPGQPLSGVFNDFSGSEPWAWRLGVPTYGLLTYLQLYTGIELQYQGLPDRFKGTFTVTPGADPAQIRWRYKGASSVEINHETGELWIEVPGQAGDGAYLVEGAPLVWQATGGHKVIVPARYEMDSAGVVGYAFGVYDTSRPLVIDPTVSYTP